MRFPQQVLTNSQFAYKTIAPTQGRLNSIKWGPSLLEGPRGDDAVPLNRDRLRSVDLV